MHIVPLEWMTDPVVTLAFRSVLENPKYFEAARRRPIWVQTNRDKEFLNKTFQDMFKHENIQFHVCINPDVKYEIVERSYRTKIYKHFTVR